MAVATIMLDQIMTSLDRADVSDRPFSHLYVEDFFPREFYRGLIDNLPSADSYYAMAEKRLTPEGDFTRTGFDLTPDGVAAMPQRSRELWSEVIDALAHEEFKRKVFGLLATDLASRFSIAPKLVPDLPVRCIPKLFRDVSGYRIDPHPDTRRKIVTMMIYLPRDDSQRELGTSLYRRRTTVRGLVDKTARFEEVKRFPFMPASGFAFVVSNRIGKRSWHGREPLPQGSTVRHSLAMTFYAPDDKACEGY